jgi:predicted nuclease of predicted toxin-antitoxin system
VRSCWPTREASRRYEPFTAWVDRLNAAGLPAVHWSRVGRMDAADIEIMAYAAKHDYVVLTHDLDFSAILAATQGTKPSVVQIRSDNLSPAAVALK